MNNVCAHEHDMPWYRVVYIYTVTDLSVKDLSMRRMACSVLAAGVSLGLRWRWWCRRAPILVVKWFIVIQLPNVPGPSMVIGMILPLICHRFITACGEEMTKQRLVLLQNEWPLLRCHVRHSRLESALLQAVNTMIEQRWHCDEQIDLPFTYQHQIKRTWFNAHYIEFVFEFFNEWTVTTIVPKYSYCSPNWVISLITDVD